VLSAGAPADPDGGLAAQRLLVQRSFAGQRGPRARQVPVELDEVEDQIDAGPHPRTQHGQGGETDAAGGAGPRRIAGRGVGCLFNGVGPVRKRPLQLAHLLGGGAFLGCVDGGRADRGMRPGHARPVGRCGTCCALFISSPAAPGAPRLRPEPQRFTSREPSLAGLTGIASWCHANFLQ
jgi:hypothetical protein